MGAGLNALLRQHLATLPGVEAIFTLREGDITHVWTVVGSASRRLEDAVYAREARILDKFGRATLDFHLTVGHNAWRPRRDGVCIFRRSRAFVPA